MEVLEDDFPFHFRVPPFSKRIQRFQRPFVPVRSDVSASSDEGQIRDRLTKCHLSHGVLVVAAGGFRAVHGMAGTLDRWFLGMGSLYSKYHSR